MVGTKASLKWVNRTSEVKKIRDSYFEDFFSKKNSRNEMGAEEGWGSQMRFFLYFF